MYERNYFLKEKRKQRMQQHGGGIGVADQINFKKDSKCH